jgi:small subunit ribosomal protein S16
MSVKIRLSRVGKPKHPHYRIIAADTRSARDAKVLEILGTYMPRREPSAVTVDTPRLLRWLHHGALPSERVRKLLVACGAWAEFEASKAAKSSAATSARS